MVNSNMGLFENILFGVFGAAFLNFLLSLAT